MPRQRKSSSLGSGFVIDPSGIVITNNHVIADANEVTVIFTDGQKLKAEVIGKDQKVDVAVLRVKPEKPLKAVKFGDSDKARVGDWVLAVGNPFGLGGSVTAGIVSARNRNIDSGPYDNYIQTDAAINKGNSGGPLFNMDGEVIGINTAILSPSGGSVGIGFATPANTVQPVIEQLQQIRRDAARLARRAHPERRRRHRRNASISARRAARSSPASTTRAPRSRPASRPATSSSNSTASRSRNRAICRSSSRRPRSARTSRSSSCAAARSRPRRSSSAGSRTARRSRAREDGKEKPETDEPGRRRARSASNCRASPTNCAARFQIKDTVKNGVLDHVGRSVAPTPPRSACSRARFCSRSIRSR